MPENDAARRGFIEAMGHIFETDGLARITGQLLALLVLEEAPLSGSRIAEILQVSRASVSTNVRLLESLGIVEKRSKPRERQAFYAVRKDAYANYIRQTALRQIGNAERIAASARAMESGPAQARVLTLVHFYRSIADHLGAAADHLAENGPGPC